MCSGKKKKESRDYDLYSRRILAIVQPYKFQHSKLEDDTKNMLLLLYISNNDDEKRKLWRRL